MSEPESIWVSVPGGRVLLRKFWIPQPATTTQPTQYEWRVVAQEIYA